MTSSKIIFWTFISSEEYSVCDVDVVVRRDWRFLSLMGLSWWVNFISFIFVYDRKLTGSIVVYIPEDPSHDLVVELLLEFIRVRSLGIYRSSLNNNILAGQNWKIIAENMERLLIQMLISGLVKDVVKYVSQKEVIWNEERDNIKYRKDLISIIYMVHIIWTIFDVSTFIPNKSLGRTRWCRYHGKSCTSN